MGARVAARCLGSVLLAVLLASLLTAASAPAATLSETFCSSGSAAGQCANPSGVAVDQSGGPGGAGGTVYVVDQNNRRIDVFGSAGHFLMAFGLGVATGAPEIQTCTTVCGRGPENGSFEPAGVAVDQSSHDVYVAEPGSIGKFAFDPLTEKFESLLSFGGGVLDGGATGTGDLTAGSTTVTGVITTSRRFEIGQTLTGPGLPAGAKIVELPFQQDSIVLSRAATATAKGVALTAPTPPTNNPVNQVDAVTLGGAPSGGIFNLAGLGASFTAATVPGSPDLSSISQFFAEADLTAGSKTIVIHGGISPVRLGQIIAGPGIPPGTTVTEETKGSGTGLSAAATITALGVGFSVTAHGSGNVVSGSSELASVANVGEFLAGQTITGAGIPATTTIKAVNEAEGKLTLSANATASGTGVALTATVRPKVVVGEGIAGAGIPAGATVASVAANGDLTLSANATAFASGSDLQSGVPFDASAATLKSLLESTFGAGAVEVTGAVGGPWEVEFKGRYADTNIKMSADGSGLTPSGKVEVNTVVAGASGSEVCTAAEISEGYLCLPGVPGQGTGQLNTGTVPLAVDPATHDVWAGGLDRLESFGAGGEYLSEVKPPGAGNVAALAVDAAGNFYVRSGASPQGGEVENDVPGVRKYDAAGNPVASWGEGGAVDSAGYAAGLALDPANGSLYVGDCPTGASSAHNCPGYTLLRFNSSGEETLAYGAGEVIEDPYGNALAFGDAAQRLYLADGGSAGLGGGQIFTLPAAGPLIRNGSTAAVSVRKTTATLDASVDPEGKATSYRFQYITEAQFKKNEEEAHEGFAGAAQTPLSGSIGEDFSSHPVSAALTGLATATAYRFRVIAFNSNEPAGVKGETASFETLPPASVDASAALVTSSSATLIAEINPLGDATSYRFQYIAREAMLRNEEAGEPPFKGAVQAPATEVPIGAGEEPVSVSQHVQGLAPHTDYRYRVVVLNAVAPEGFGSQTLAFTTQAPAGAPILPDSRGWELVSPPNKHGGLLGPIAQEGVIQAAASGGAIAYLANAPTEAEPRGLSGFAQVLSVRGAGGWSARDLQPSHPKATEAQIGQGEEFRFFSTDLSLGVLQPVGDFEPALSPAASEQTPYVRSDYGAQPSTFCAESCYRPLLTPADVTSGARFSTCANKEVCVAHFIGATPDLSHVMLQSQVGLTSVPGDKGGLYEYGEGRIALVSVLPNGTPAETHGNLTLGFNNQIARGAISPDGSRVFWSNEISGRLQFYLRYNATREQSAVDGSGQCTEPEKACTIQLDERQGGSGSGEPRPIFQFASEDGSRVFFTDIQPLTQDSGASGGAPDLYECRIEEVAGRLSCALSDLTPLVGGESGHAESTMLGASADGSYAYFVASSIVAGAAANERGETAHTGQPNLYLRHQGATTFIATLSTADSPDWADGFQNLGALTARVSSNGRWLAFMSQRSLTGYDNRDAVSGQPDEEVFLYHTGVGGGGGKLICASCNPTGARPHGLDYGPDLHPNMPLAGGNRVWSAVTWIAANIPGWTPYKSGAALYQSRYLSNDGRLFFNASDALVPQDTNGTEDVYQYEPPKGEGSPPNDGCSETDPAYNSAATGCVSLISSGTSPEESAFLDASETGEDVFFLTSSRLSPLDTDGARDVYDAHACTQELPCPPLPPAPAPSCQGDACQAPAVAPEQLTPSSLTFSGAGNLLPAATRAVAPKAKPPARAQKLASELRACRKKKAKRKRASCEKQARRAYGSTAKANKSRKGAGK